MYINHPTIKFFLAEMNKSAQKLGLTDTFYDSPHGLMNKNNISTAHDVCLLIAECMQNSLFRQVVQTQIYETKAQRNTRQSTTFMGKPMNQYKWTNTNKLLGNLEGLIGCKTGITQAAGPCFAGYYEKGGLKLALVLCSSKSMELRWLEIEDLVEWISSVDS